MRLDFTKMHGLGNDFVVVDDLDGRIDLAPEQVASVCDRHLGVGADGVILVRRDDQRSDGFFMHYFNANGSLAEMCGNGIRCLAKYVVDRGIAGPSPLHIRTLGGPRDVSFETDTDGRMSVAAVDMGAPVLDPAAIPAHGPDGPGERFDLAVGADTLSFTAVSMGNPHAVTVVRSVAEALVGDIGPLVEAHPAFPERTNVEFVEVVSDSRILLRVWERGVGETLACGTGACAAAVACILAGVAGHELSVGLPGGDLEITWPGEGPVLMTGPAEEVFSGSMDL